MRFSLLGFHISFIWADIGFRHLCFAHPAFNLAPLFCVLFPFRLYTPCMLFPLPLLCIFVLGFIACKHHCSSLITSCTTMFTDPTPSTFLLSLLGLFYILLVALPSLLNTPHYFMHLLHYSITLPFLYSTFVSFLFKFHLFIKL